MSTPLNSTERVVICKTVLRVTSILVLGIGAGYLFVHSMFGAGVWMLFALTLIS